MHGSIPCMGSFLAIAGIMNEREARSRMPRASRRRCALLRTVSLSAAGRRASRNIDGSGRTGRSAARTIISSGRRRPYQGRPVHPGRRLRNLPGGQARHALAAAQVTGIDFSATSVRCTEELKRKYKLDNLQVHQLPIERAHELETSFDQIVCTGVLHHLADPDAGLQRPARRARSRTARCTSWCMRRTVGPASTCCRTSADGSASAPTDAEIRDLIAALKALPPGHPLQNLLREAPDFRNEAALADALLHPWIALIRSRSCSTFSTGAA